MHEFGVALRNIWSLASSIWSPTRLYSKTKLWAGGPTYSGWHGQAERAISWSGGKAVILQKLGEGWEKVTFGHWNQEKSVYSGCTPAEVTAHQGKWMLGHCRWDECVSWAVSGQKSFCFLHAVVTCLMWDSEAIKNWFFKKNVREEDSI